MGGKGFLARVIPHFADSGLSFFILISKGQTTTWYRHIFIYLKMKELPTDFLVKGRKISKSIMLATMPVSQRVRTPPLPQSFKEKPNVNKRKANSVVLRGTHDWTRKKKKKSKARIKTKIHIVRSLIKYLGPSQNLVNIRCGICFHSYFHPFQTGYHLISLLVIIINKLTVQNPLSANYR